MKNAQSKFAQTLGSVYQSRHRVLLTGKNIFFVIWPVQTRFEYNLSKSHISDIFLFCSIPLTLVPLDLHAHTQTFTHTQTLPQALLCRTIYLSCGLCWTSCYPLSSHPLTHSTSGSTNPSLHSGTSLTPHQVQWECVSVCMYTCACAVRVCGASWDSKAVDSVICLWWPYLLI
jgi:hypothetical protein